jgi:hypothetical protein
MGDWGVIWNSVSFEMQVIPAKPGIQLLACAFQKVCGVDSRFRGNGSDLRRACPANDITNQLV